VPPAADRVPVQVALLPPADVFPIVIADRVLEVAEDLEVFFNSLCRLNCRLVINGVQNNRSVFTTFTRYTIRCTEVPG